MSQVLDLLKKAAEIWDDHGGAVGDYTNEAGQVDAVGALLEAAIGRPLRVDDGIHLVTDGSFRQALDVLDYCAPAGMTAAALNDDDLSAVPTLYKYAIEEAHFWGYPEPSL